MGGLGLRSASRTSQSAFWASWADSLSMIRERHPTVADFVVRRLEQPEDLTPTMASVVQARHHLSGVEGFEPPSWEALVQGARPLGREPEDFEPGGTRSGWQHEASSRTDLQFRGRVMATLAEHEQALLRSQSGPLAGTPFSAAPSNWLTRIEPHLFRVLFLRRLVSLFLFLHVSVVVAVLWTSLAIIALRVREREFWTTGVCSRECGSAYLP